MAGAGSKLAFAQPSLRVLCYDFRFANPAGFLALRFAF